MHLTGSTILPILRMGSRATQGQVTRGGSHAGSRIHLSREAAPPPAPGPPPTGTSQSADGGLTRVPGATEQVRAFPKAVPPGELGRPGPFPSSGGRRLAGCLLAGNLSPWPVIAKAAVQSVIPQLDPGERLSGAPRCYLLGYLCVDKISLPHKSLPSAQR